MNDIKKGLVQSPTKARTRPIQTLDNKLKKTIEMLHSYKRNIVSVAPIAHRERASTIHDCFSWYQFRHYPEYKKLSSENKVTRAFSCNQYKLCPICAMRRSRKVFASLIEKIQFLDLKPEELHLVTITVKNNESLEEALEELRGFYGFLMQGKKNATRRKWNPETSPWGTLAGWIGHCEITKSEKGWHPHFHFLVVSKPEFAHLMDFKKVKCPFGTKGAYWGSLWTSYIGKKLHQYTKGTSYIVHSERVGNELGSIAEVSKYLFKFSEMEPKDVWEAWEITRGKRLSSTGGIFRGIKLEPKELLDEIDENETRPWIDWLCTFTKNNSWSDKVVGSNNCDFAGFKGKNGEQTVYKIK